MKNKALLALMEQVIMLLVLAVAATVCLQVFTQAHHKAHHNTLQDQSLQQLENTAQVLKHTRGDLDRLCLELGGSHTDGQWILDTEAYTLTAVLKEAPTPLLGIAELSAVTQQGVISTLTVSWQEVEP